MRVPSVGGVGFEDLRVVDTVRFEHPLPSFPKKVGLPSERGAGTKLCVDSGVQPRSRVMGLGFRVVQISVRPERFHKVTIKKHFSPSIEK